MPKHEAIHYLEFPSRDLAATKAFFEKCFGWTFTDYGPDYASFSDQDIDGGFYRADQAAAVEGGSVLVVFYSAQLEATQRKVEQAGGKISKPIFSFPGGRRFHFTEPSGSELAVWSDLPPARVPLALPVNRSLGVVSQTLAKPDSTQPDNSVASDE